MSTEAQAPGSAMAIGLRPRRILVAAAVTALLVLHWAPGTWSLREKCQTYDETVHLTAGFAYWKFADFRLHPENGNLPQRWVALPLFLDDRVQFPDRDQPAWHKSRLWEIGDQFCHQVGNDLAAMLRNARAAAALFGVAICLVVFFWSRSLFGTAGGLLSLLLCALSPTLLAHAPLATSDASAALFFTLSAGAIWRVLQRVTLTRVLCSAVAVGGLFLSKHSAMLIVPICLLMVAAHWLAIRRLSISLPGWQAEAATRGKYAATLAIITLAHMFVACVLIWAAFSWRHSPVPPGGEPVQLNKFVNMERAARATGALGSLLYFVNEQRLLPEAYLYGVTHVLAHRQRGGFLNGEYFLRGRRHYFLYCVLVKTPLGLFGLLAAAAWLGIRRLRAAQRSSGESFAQSHPLIMNLVPLAALLFVYWATAVTSSLNIGHRHMLPTYPAMFILAGGAAGWLSRATPVAAMAVVLFLAAFVGESVRAYPNYLAYFNPIVPRETAHQHLVDSNLDWGQDLPGLKRWLDEHAAEVKDSPVYLAYFGTGSPEYWGIRARRLPVFAVAPDAPPFEGGWYCISATALANLYGEAPGRWNMRYENIYRDALAMEERQFAGLSPDDQQYYEQLLLWLRSSRLYAWLRQRQPDDHVNYSILIYKLSDADVRQALEGPPAELDRLSWAQQEGDP